MVISIRTTQVTNSASSDAATDTCALSWSLWTIHTGNVSNRSSEAMVYSPSTSATVSTIADSRAVVRFGRMTRHSVVIQPDPSELAASVIVFRSSARSPASIARYANGIDKTTYSRESMYGEALSHPGATWSTPTISTTGGMTIGRIVSPSRTRRSPGSRRWT
jgi:hypothetical protein